MAWCFSTRASVATVLTTHPCVSQCLRVNPLRQRQNGCHFADNIFKCIFLNKNVWISLKILLKFVPKVRINNIPALVQVMAWHLPGTKPLSEPMMVKLLMHICITWPLRPAQNGQHFIDSIFKCIFLNQNISQSIFTHFTPVCTQGFNWQQNYWFW